jgi:hypothetical protein
MRARYALCVVLAFGLGGCPTVDLGDSPEDVGLCNPAQGEAYFEASVWPMFLDDSSSGGTRQCTKGGCHDQNGQSALRFKTNPIDFQANFKTTQIYLNCGSPTTSRLLEKPLTGPETHGGGDIFMTLDDPDVKVFLGWFNP